MTETKESDIEMMEVENGGLRRPSAIDTHLPTNEYIYRDPWLIFTQRNPTDGSDLKWAKKASSLDIFPYSRPASVNTSVKGAIISIAAIVIMIAVVVTNIIVLVRGNEDISMQSSARLAKKYELPRFVVKSSGSLGKAPKSMNYSWFRVRFTQVNDDKSDPNHRKKTLKEIPAEFCEFDQGNMKVEGWCAPTANLYAEGEYADPMFRYVAVTVEPCWYYGGKNPGDLDFEGKPIVHPMPSVTCENETNINKAFCYSEGECDPSYGTFSLNVLDRRSIDFEKWSSPIYFNVEPQLWMGIEVFFKPTEGSRTGLWGTLGFHQLLEWMQFDKWYTRKVPHGVSPHLLKFYLRVSDSMEKQRYSQRGVSGMVEAIGSAWATITITLGLLARWYNSFKYVADPNRPREERALTHTEAKKAIVAHVDEIQRRNDVYDFWTAPVMTELRPSKSTNKLQVPDASKDISVKRTYICPHCTAQMEIDADTKMCEICEGEIVANVMDHAERQSRQKDLQSTADILFCFDTTGSMSQCIGEVRRHLESTINDLFDRIPSIRIGIIAHGDYTDEKSTYCLKSLSFSRNRQRIKEFLQSTTGTGGGDVDEECYELALHHANQMEWRGNEKVFVLIGDSRPHEKDYEGFSKGKYKFYDWRVEAQNLATRGVSIHAVQCLNRQECTSFYTSLAQISKHLGGKHLKLGEFIDMPDLFVAICMKHAASSKEYNQFQAEMAERVRGSNGERYSWLRTLGILGATMLGSAAAGMVESQM